MSASVGSWVVVATQQATESDSRWTRSAYPSTPATKTTPQLTRKMDSEMEAAGQMKRDQLRVFSDKLSQYLNKLETFSPEKYRGIPDDSLKKVQALENESYDLQQRYDDVTAKIQRRQQGIEATQTKLTNTEIAVRNSLAPYQKLLERLKDEETKLRQQVVDEGKLSELKAYLLQQARMVEEEESLKQELADKEAQLAELRTRLCDVDVNAFPEHERANAELYKKWKTCVQCRPVPVNHAVAVCACVCVCVCVCVCACERACVDTWHLWRPVRTNDRWPCLQDACSLHLPRW